MTHSRREFLKRAGFLSTGVSLGLTSFPAAARETARTFQSKEERAQLRPEHNYNAPDLSGSVALPLNKEADLVSLMKSAGVMFLGKMSYLLVMEGLKRETGEDLDPEGAVRQLKRNPARATAIYALAVPLVEEALFRGMPSLLLDLLGADRAEVGTGIVSSLAFAALHGLRSKDDQNGKTEYKLKYFPPEQFVLGMFYWHVCRTMGLGYSILSHVAINSTALLTIKLADKLTPSQAN